MKLYLAGPLFTSAEKTFNRALAGFLRGLGHQVFLPQESEESRRAEAGELEDPASDIFHSDVDGIDCCDAVVACLDGSDPDSGTSWELGYAYATDKWIVAYRTDIRVHEGFDPINLMLTESAHALIYHQSDDVLSLAHAINSQLAELERDSSVDD